MVIDKLIVIENGEQKFVDSADNKVIDVINHNGADYHFAKENEVQSGVCENAVAEPIIDMKVHGNSVQGKLPSEYQRVEFLEATGEQYIELNYIASGITSSKGKYQITDVSVARMLFGSRPHAGAENTYAFNWGGGIPYKLYNSYSAPVQLQFEVDTNAHTFYKDKGYLYLDDKLLHGKEEKEFVTPYKMVVFGCNTGNVIGLFALAKIYYLQFYDNDTLMVDLIPCYRKSDNVAGLYDLVTNTFYTNKGTGSFIVGNDVIPSPETPIEIISVGEKTNNLIDISSISNNYCTVVNGALEVRIIAGNSSSGCGKTLKQLCPDIEVGKTYTLSFVIDSDYSSAISIGSFGTTANRWESGNQRTITEADLEANVRFGVFDAGERTITFSNIQITEQPTNVYEPYGYKMPVKVSGKNLFKSTDNVLGSLDVTTGGTTSPTLYNYITTSDFISLKAGTYIISYKSGSNLRYVGLYNQNKEIESYFWSERKNPYKFTLDKDYLVRIDMEREGKVAIENKDTFYVDYKVQLEVGTKASEYVSYIEPTTTNIYLNEPLRKLGEYADYIDYKNKKVVRNICEEKPVCQNILNFAKGFTVVISKPSLNTDTTKRYVLCNYMKGSNSLPVATERAGKVFIGSISNYVGFGETELFPIAGEDFPTEDELIVFKNWLDSTNVLVYYVLKTPEEETIDIPEIKTFDGTNIFTVETIIEPSDMSMVYWKQIMPEGNVEEETDNITQNGSNILIISTGAKITQSGTNLLIGG